MKTKFILHYRESPDGIQWEKEHDTKPEADAEAYKIFINGGIAIVVEVDVEIEADDVVLSKLPEEDEGDDNEQG